MAEMELYSGFAWAVPKAFGSALHGCRFEQGDVLYSNASSYDESKRSKRSTGYHIQVLDPARSSRAIGGDGENQRFFANWESPVCFEWMDYRAGERSERQSSQGALFTCLWKGDLKVLRGDPQADLPRPKLLRDLQSRVAECSSAMVEQFEKPRRAGKSSKRAAGGRRLFATAFDQSSEASRVKVQSIERALEAKFEVAVRRFAPAELELDGAAEYHPTLGLLGIAIATDDEAEIERVLRDVLYAGGKAVGKEGGRFQLTRHGSLVGLD
jgi:hypothetical protein